MPYRVPRARTEQEAYNLQLQQQFDATRRVDPYVPGRAPAGPTADRDPIADLRELARLHEAGALSDKEFAAAKAKLLGLEGTAT